MEVTEARASMTFSGLLSGRSVEAAHKLFRDARSFYLDTSDGIKDGSVPSDDTVMYEVRSYTEGQTKRGNLNWGVTKLQPVTVNGECNMTRGHWHDDRACAEFYYGLSGKGILLLMNESEGVRMERVCSGSLHHIDGRCAHRLVNTGDEPLVVAACWGCDAGHDYTAMERKPFPIRIFRNPDGEIRFEPMESEETYESL